MACGRGASARGRASTRMLAQRARSRSRAPCRPTISGSSTAGAHGSLRDQMPRCASRMSPLRMSRSARASRVAFGCRSLGSSSPRKPAGLQPTCDQPQAPAAAEQRRRRLAARRAEERAACDRPSSPRSAPTAVRARRSTRPPSSAAPGRPRGRRSAACESASPSSASQRTWLQVCEPKAWPSAARAFHHGAQCVVEAAAAGQRALVGEEEGGLDARGARAPRRPAAPRPCGRCRR